MNSNKDMFYANMGTKGCSSNGLDLREENRDSKGPSPFCQRCLNNQMLVKDALAEYLPCFSDPDYPMYERALPEYKASLEKRYPMTCSACESRVHEQLQQNNYRARSITLAGFLQRSKTILEDQRTSSFSYLTYSAWFLHGILYFICNAAFCCFCLLLYLRSEVFAEDLLRYGPNGKGFARTSELFEFVLRAQLGLAIRSGDCARSLQTLYRLTLCSSVISFWDSLKIFSIQAQPCVKKPRLRKLIVQTLGLALRIGFILWLKKSSTLSAKSIRYSAFICCVVIILVFITTFFDHFVPQKTALNVQKAQVSRLSQSEYREGKQSASIPQARTHYETDNIQKVGVETYSLGSRTVVPGNYRCNFSNRPFSDEIGDKMAVDSVQESRDWVRECISGLPVNANSDIPQKNLQYSSAKLNSLNLAAPRLEFGKNEQTGLESLFSTALGLDDDHIKRGYKSGSRASQMQKISSYCHAGFQIVGCLASIFIWRFVRRPFVGFVFAFVFVILDTCIFYRHITRTSNIVALALSMTLANIGILVYLSPSSLYEGLQAALLSLVPSLMIGFTANYIISVQRTHTSSHI